MKLKGKILGFEEEKEYILSNPFGKNSPYRVLSSLRKPIVFLLVNPYEILDDYTLEVDERILEEEIGIKDKIEKLAVMCIVRIEDEALYVNLRSPLIINTKNGRFCQVILENDGYGVSVPFAVKKEA